MTLKNGTIKKNDCMNNNERTVNTMELFDATYLNSKAMYIHSFNKVPWVTMIYYIDGQKAFEVFRQTHGALINSVLGYRTYEKLEEEFNRTLVELNNQCLLEFDNTYCEILHDGNKPEFVKELVKMFRPLKQRHRRKPLEINLVVSNGRYLELKSMEIKRTRLDIGLFYDDSFKKIDEVIRKRLNTKKDKGIVLLHGLPGTGKTTYLRYLIGKIKKRVLFLSPNIASNLVEPEFVQLLIDNPNSVLIIEDAENIIMDRKINGKSSVSSLLNISDGLLADFLNVQLICTFNNALTLIDSALMRKGRLIARYEFGKLNVEKAQRLSDQLGFDTLITKPMTLAEIANQKEMDHKMPQIESIGFRNN
jgi:hypothetical protein